MFQTSISTRATHGRTKRFFVALTNYYSERTTKEKTYNALVRQIKLCCQHQNKDVIIGHVFQFNLKQLHNPD
jgi:hypothetical protein